MRLLTAKQMHAMPAGTLYHDVRRNCDVGEDPLCVKGWSAPDHHDNAFTWFFSLVDGEMSDDEHEDDFKPEYDHRSVLYHLAVSEEGNIKEIGFLDQCDLYLVYEKEDLSALQDILDRARELAR